MFIKLNLIWWCKKWKVKIKICPEKLKFLAFFLCFTQDFRWCPVLSFPYEDLYVDEIEMLLHSELLNQGRNLIKLWIKQRFLSALMMFSYYSRTFAQVKAKICRNSFEVIFSIIFFSSASIASDNNWIW